MTMADAPKTSSEDRATSKKISALGALWPFVVPYRVMVVAALAALVLTACVSLIMPLAARRVIDNFDVENGEIGLNHPASAPVCGCSVSG